MTPGEGLKCNDSLKWLTVNDENTVNLSSVCIKVDKRSTLAQAEPFRRRVSGEQSCGGIRKGRRGRDSGP